MTHALALVTEAFGGRGGIARYNRDFLRALALSDHIRRITVVPRLCQDPPGALPAKIEQRPPISRPINYSAVTIARLILDTTPSMIFCGHINMSPLASMLCEVLRIPLWLQVHGIDAWGQPSQSVKWATERSTLITSVSRYTKSMMSRWWDGDPSRLRVLPNTVGDQFSPGEKPKALLDRYGLGEKKVILTVSRLTRSDRYKGRERIIANLQAISCAVPNVTYLIVGDGDDKNYLEKLASMYGVSQRVVFAGHVSEESLPDHYRVADVYAMPSTKEGFGIVFLEAALSGLAVIAGNRDGSVDALADGSIGNLVDPLSDEQIASTLIALLGGGSNSRRDEARRFAFDSFAKHVNHLSETLLRGREAGILELRFNGMKRR